MARTKGAENKHKPVRDRMRAYYAADDFARIDRLIKVLDARAQAGDIPSLAIIFDRLDGKPVQALAGDDEAGPVRHIITWNDADD